MCCRLLCAGLQVQSQQVQCIYNIYYIIYNISNMSRYYSLVTVDCSGAPLASPPDLDTVEVTPQQRLALNLSHTGLEDADLATLAGATNYQKVE